MNSKELIKQYINQQNVMQLATAVDNQPYACNVHFYADDDLNFYWVSLESRRHSKEIDVNPKVSAVIKVHENTAEEDYVIGLTVIGEAEPVSGIDQSIANAYAEKLGKEPSTLDGVATGKGPARFYRLKPSQIVLFDSHNFPTDPRQELAF